MTPYYVCILILGLILLYFSSYLCYKSISLIRKGIRTTAEVIEIEKISRDSKGTNYEYTSILRYFDQSDISHTYVRITYSPPYEIGDKVQIVYNPEDPEEMKTFSYWGLFRRAIFLLISAMPFLIISGGYFLYLLMVK